MSDDASRGHLPDELFATILSGGRGDVAEGDDLGFEIRVVQGIDAGKTFMLHRSLPSRVLVGTSPSCELRLTDREVSRRHASLEIVGHRLRLLDLDSTNGTLVDRVSVVGAYLHGGEVVRVGSTSLGVVRGPVPKAPPAPTVGAFGRMLGACLAMRRLYPLCERLAASNVPVIIEGETGTGKEVFAEALHERGPRASGPFVVFDCTAVAPNLVESELFGHERGAFTGAVGARKGVFEQAHGGTLLIDEIGDLDLSLQPKLLRALERSEVRRVGGDRPIRVEVRVLSATRRDLDREVQNGRFRDDLFHRLAVARIELPPLRDRTGDVAVLARHFANVMSGGTVELAAELLARWEQHSWPGNVRELRNAVARHVALGDLAPEPRGEGTAGPGTGGAGGDFVDQVLSKDLPHRGATAAQVVDEFERRYIAHVLEKNGGNVSRAAEASGVARRHFQRLRARGAT